MKCKLIFSLHWGHIYFPTHLHSFHYTPPASYRLPATPARTRRLGKFFKFHTFNCSACSLPPGQLRPLVLCVGQLAAVAAVAAVAYECLTFNRTKFYDCPHYYVCTVLTIFCVYLLSRFFLRLPLLSAHFALVLKICLFAPYLSCILF